MRRAVRLTAVVATLALCAPTLTLSTTHAPGRPGAAASSTPSRSAAAPGWYAVDMHAEFARTSQIAAIRPMDSPAGSVEITALSFHQRGVALVPSYERAVLNLRLGTWSGHPVPAAAPTAAAPDGGVQLVFPQTFPTHDQTTSVKIEHDGRIIATWPRAVPLYASAQNPVGAAPGALDNEIIGRSGEWLWIALKGPQYPASAQLRDGGIFSGFRTWNRIVALNLQDNRYRLYAIPASAFGSPSADSYGLPPTFAAVGGRVFIGIHSWLGVFPANPTSLAHVQVVRPIPTAVVAARARAMLQSLSRREWQEINSIAIWWDNTVGAREPGIPQRLDGYKPMTWNQQPTIFNHGLLPDHIVWAMNFPLTDPGQIRSRNTMLNEALLLMLSPVNRTMTSPAFVSTTQLKAYLKKTYDDIPPIKLPGYVIAGDAWRPLHPWIPLLGTRPLPRSFDGYADVYDAIDPWLQVRSPIPVLLPQPDSALGYPEPIRGTLDVIAHATDTGYALCIGGGPALPLNSPKISIGSAEQIVNVLGIDPTAPIPQDWRPPISFAIPGVAPQRVMLGPGIDGLYYAKKAGARTEESLTWRQYGITWGIPAQCECSVVPTARKQLVPTITRSDSYLQGLGVHGTGAFCVGSDNFSKLCVKTPVGFRYVLCASSWRVPQIAGSMCF